MKKISRIFFLILLFVPTISAASDQDSLSLEQAILERINVARYNPWTEAERLGLNSNSLRQSLPVETAVAWDRSLAPLSPNDQLNEAAVEHCRDMIDLNYFTSTSPDGETSVDRVAATGYQADLVREEIGAMAFEFFIQADQAGSEMLDTLLLKAFNQASESVTSLLDTKVEEAGIAMESGTIAINGFQYNIYALTIVVARPVDAINVDSEFIQCGHLYSDLNGNDTYDYGEGLSGEVMQIYFPSGNYPVITGKEGVYCLSTPESLRVIRICQWYDIQFSEDVEARAATSGAISLDYDAWYFDCEVK
ncbi:MAG: hypothetical protein KQH63_18285 [Desulfobulbaceae bacterium]|nr:hypothetical protein [Desulfobulbaceae bacterium]